MGETALEDLFDDESAILNSIVSNSYYGMLRGQISVFDMQLKRSAGKPVRASHNWFLFYF